MRHELVHGRNIIDAVNVHPPTLPTSSLCKAFYLVDSILVDRAILFESGLATVLPLKSNPPPV